WLVEGVMAKRAQTQESASDRFAHVLLMGTAFYLVAIYDPRLGKLNWRFMGEHWWVTDSGVALTMAGVGLAIWARHHIGRYWSARVSIVSEHKLIHTGPYGRIRHPIYTGILMALAGTALVVGEYRALLGLGIAWFGFAMKARKEEQFLAARFGREFEEHRRRTGFLLPKVF
ncbi:MAG TPA: isoprenylcysteine carboxylmethyltransferase family protein, partial [Candidatus Limnocylindria bacterium]|nr:isoprenylcysteine carboxylmethyltransferase family protein [Candidatus Limnocylindria bacterium]